MKKLLLLAALAATVSTPALAETAIEKALKERQGKSATVVLESGTELTGTVSKIDEGAVRLTELSGKEFYDAVVAVEDISAVVMRVRTQ
ncbi:MAG TPA: hypothetical protein VJM11_05785 [Nevskiaceae bacterium]|nr:hypothetical protein [Nevskiaceae bacterium]